MDQHPAYETLIAQKLEQAPLPDLADSIWAAIQLELDSPLPGEGGQEPPAQAPPGKGLPGAGGLVYIVLPALLLTAAWLLFKNKRQRQPVKNTPVLQAPADTLKADSAAEYMQQKRQDAGPSGIKPADRSGGTNGFVLPDLVPDSVFQPVVPPLAADSISLFPGDAVPAGKDSTAKKLPGVKSRGVKGISDNDYKIKTEKRDSIKKDP